MVDHAFESRTRTLGLEIDQDNVDLVQLFAPLARHWRTFFGCTVLAGAIGAAASYLITPTFISTATVLPPQQQQSVAASALSSLGSLAGIAGGSGIRNPADQYVALMQSVTVSDRVIERFHLMKLYDKKYRRDARKLLSENVQIVVGKKDGLLSINVEDTDPVRAAAMANDYVEELRLMTSVLAVSEAQQRRIFFEKQMNDTKVRLTAAQTALQGTGFNMGAMKSEPRSAADEYARLRADTTVAEVRLQTLRNSMTETSPEVQQQTATVQALRAKLGQLEQSTAIDSQAPDYVTKYRNFKYEETLFDLFAKQYELARVDESREGALIQVLDPAQPAELKSKPRRSVIAMLGGLVGALVSGTWLITRSRRHARRPPPIAAMQ